MDPDLSDEWTSMEPQMCGGCAAYARAQDRSKDREHPHAWKHVLGLREGWQARKAAKVAARTE